MGAFVKNDLAQGLAKEPTRSNFQAGRPEGATPPQGEVSKGHSVKKVQVDPDQSHLSDIHAVMSSPVPEDTLLLTKK